MPFVRRKKKYCERKERKFLNTERNFWIEHWPGDKKRHMRCSCIKNIIREDKLCLNSKSVLLRPNKKFSLLFQCSLGISLDPNTWAYFRTRSNWIDYGRLSFHPNFNALKKVMERERRGNTTFKLLLYRDLRSQGKKKMCVFYTREKRKEIVAEDVSPQVSLFLGHGKRRNLNGFDSVHWPKKKKEI